MGQLWQIKKKWDFLSDFQTLWCKGRDMRVLQITKAGPGKPNVWIEAGIHARGNLRSSLIGTIFLLITQPFQNGLLRLWRPSLLIVYWKMKRLLLMIWTFIFCQVLIRMATCILENMIGKVKIRSEQFEKWSRNLFIGCGAKLGLIMGQSFCAKA